VQATERESGDVHDDLSAHRRMRRSLHAIRDLDPDGVDLRIKEFDAEIARLERLLSSGRSAHAGHSAEERDEALGREDVRSSVVFYRRAS
jgi:D-serine deaminase-like pyridoxal phosphate-dependent protein